MTNGWSRKFDRCVKCGQTNSSYRGKGMCTTCYDETRRRAKGQIDKKQVCEHKLVDGIELVYCRHCNIWKPITEFTKGLRRRDGLKSFCRDCENKYYKGKRENIDKRQTLRRQQRVNERKQQVLAQQKGGCYLCGTKFDTVSVYDFHHINPNNKQYLMAQLVGRASVSWVKESQKCVLLCAVCHRLVHKHIKRKNNYDNILYSMSRKADVERRIARVQERKLDVLNKQHGCTFCGLDYQDARLYDFHHSDSSSKERVVAQMIAYANDKWEEEAKKCVLICANCHRIVHTTGVEDTSEKCRKVVINENIICCTR